MGLRLPLAPLQKGALENGAFYTHTPEPLGGQTAPVPGRFLSLREEHILADFQMLRPGVGREHPGLGEHSVLGESARRRRQKM